jgi:hypothetical protein
MELRRGAVAICSAAALICSVTLAAQAPRKLTKAEEKERDAITKVVTSVVAGQPAPDDLGVKWAREDVMKASDNQQYVPFIVTLDPSKTQAKNLVVYWRVVSNAPAGGKAPGDKPGDKGSSGNKSKDAATPFAYESIGSATVNATDGARISRSFVALPGSYDVYVVVKEPTPDKLPKGAPPLKMSVLKKTVEVPDLWNGELNTSTVLVGRIDPLPAPLTPQQMTERPYAALGTMEITPDLENKFTKKNELSTFLLVYNAKVDGANKPDIVVEYNFYAKQAGGEKFFNKTNPQSLNAQTLPPQFDFAAGHQLQAGQAVPLASFPEGDYRLEIKVTDKLANKTLTRDVNFSVAGS